MKMDNANESTPFLRSKEVDRDDNPKRYWKVACVAISLSALVVFSGKSQFWSSDSSLSSELPTKITATNEYTARDGHAAVDYRWLEEGSLAEPFRTTVLKVSGGKVDGLDENDMLTSCAAVRQTTGDKLEHITNNGKECSMIFNKIGNYQVVATVEHAKLGVVATVTKEITVRYVRRDIRALSDTDRDALLDAFKVMYTVPVEEGQAIYGSEYRHISYFVYLHWANAAVDKHHDHLHDGMGFYSQHVAMTNDIEMALQVIDSTVSMPYWDYTQDYVMVTEAATALGRTATYTDLWNLDIWSDKYFGHTNATHNTVTTGRFANVVVPTVEAPDSLHKNAYGYMRAPWNLNDSPYVTRYHAHCGQTDVSPVWATCSEFYDAVDGYSSIGSIMYYLANFMHGQIHSAIGGASGCDFITSTDFKDTYGSDVSSKLLLKSTFLVKLMWRQGYATSPTSEECADGRDCEMHYPGCSDGDFTTTEISDYIKEMGVSSYGLTEDQKLSLIKLVLCDSKIVTGEHIESSSPIDVSFWPIHPTLERFVTYKQLVHPFTKYDWFSDTWDGGLCLWSKIFETDCTGHRETDSTASKMYIFDEDVQDFVKKNPTNREVVTLSMPDKTNLLPYVYANFDYTHCEKAGLAFPKVPKSYFEDKR